jgi:hypothetical protein
MITDRDKEALTTEQLGLATVFIGSGFAASPRPGMTPVENHRLKP